MHGQNHPTRPFPNAPRRGVSCGRPGEVRGYANTTINAGHYSHAPGPIGRPQETPLLTVAGPIGRPQETPLLTVAGPIGQETPLLTVAGPIGHPRETLLLTVARRTDVG